MFLFPVSSPSKLSNFLKQTIEVVQRTCMAVSPWTLVTLICSDLVERRRRAASGSRLVIGSDDDDDGGDDDDNEDLVERRRRAATGSRFFSTRIILG